jgi:hypothetical protein
MHPGSDRTGGDGRVPGSGGDSNTRPSDATLRNISQNMYCAVAVRSDFAPATRTRL